MSTEKTSTVLFPIPIDLLAAYKDHLSRGAEVKSDSP
jgi:hypothetical protein